MDSSHPLGFGAVERSADAMEKLGITLRPSADELLLSYGDQD